MPTVVPVKFKYAARDLWFDPEDVEIAGGDYAICRTERGTEIGLVTGDPQVVTDEYQKSICGDAALKPVPTGERRPCPSSASWSPTRGST